MSQSENMAFTGVLTSVKHLKTSGDLQFVVTVPKQSANEALRRAGGFPDPATSRWVAVAVLDETENATSSRANDADYLHRGDEVDDISARREADQPF